MRTSILRHAAYNDRRRKSEDNQQPHTHRTAREIEAAIRADIRAAVREEIRLTFHPRHQRGAAFVHDRILNRIRGHRRAHTASIAREKADLAAAKWLRGLTVPVLTERKEAA